MRIWIVALAIASAMCGALALGADPAPAAKAASETKESKAPADYIGDSVITTRVKTALLSERSIPAADISVETNKSEVALSGKVENDQQRRTALQVASAVQGVTTVKDKLSVRQTR